MVRSEGEGPAEPSFNLRAPIRLRVREVRASPAILQCISLNASRNYHLVDVILPKPLGANGTLNIVLETVQTHATTPWPETAAQKEDQALKFTTDLFVLSPYHTSVQRTKLKCVFSCDVLYVYVLTHLQSSCTPCDLVHDTQRCPGLYARYPSFPIRSNRNLWPF